MGSTVSKSGHPARAYPVPDRKLDHSQIEEHLLCPICMEIPKGEIFQCKNGHHLCSECGRKLVNCPQCLVPYEKERIRNRAMESLLDAMKMDCQYSKMGCSSKLSRAELGQHENCCGFRPVSLCKLIGFTRCNFVETQTPEVTIAHLKMEHNIAVLHGKVLVVKYVEEFLLTVQNGFLKNFRWDPILWYRDKGPGSPAFLLLCRLHGVGERIERCSWSCIYLGEEVKVGYYQVQFSIGNAFGNGQSSVLNWMDRPFHFKNMEGLLKTPELVFPCTFLLDCVEEEDGQTARKVLKVTAEILKALKGKSGGDGRRCETDDKAVSKVAMLRMITD